MSKVLPKYLWIKTLVVLLVSGSVGGLFYTLMQKVLGPVWAPRIAFGFVCSLAQFLMLAVNAALDASKAASDLSKHVLERVNIFMSSQKSHYFKGHKGLSSQAKNIDQKTDKKEE